MFRCYHTVGSNIWAMHMASLDATSSPQGMPKSFGSTIRCIVDKAGSSGSSRMRGMPKCIGCTSHCLRLVFRHVFGLASLEIGTGGHGTIYSPMVDSVVHETNIKSLAYLISFSSKPESCNSKSFNLDFLSSRPQAGPAGGP